MIDPGEWDIEDLIDDEDLVFTLSRGGYVKTVSIDEFRSQGRGGRGVAGAALKDEDVRRQDSFTRPRTRTCCSSRTRARCSASRPTRCP